MKLLADHNVEAPIVKRLRAAGHDVRTTAEVVDPEAPDRELLERAAEEERILLTNDKDFGELAFLQRRASAGIVLLRMPSLDTPTKADRVLRVLSLFGKRLDGAMVVITEERIRRRVLPDLPPSL